MSASQAQPTPTAPAQPSQPAASTPKQPSQPAAPAPPQTPTPIPPRPFEPYWVQNHRPTQLWSGLNQDAVSFGFVAPWSYFKVLEPQQGSRLRVMDARTGNIAFIEAVAVGASGPPPETDAAATEGVLQTWWVVNHAATPLWSSPGEDAINLGLAGPWNFFEVLEPQTATRFHVRDPRTGGEAYVEAATIGPAGPPNALEHPTQWWGYIGVDQVNVRVEPTRKVEITGELFLGTPVLVQRWIEGEEVVKDDPIWAELADGTYIWAQLLRRAWTETPPAPARVLDAKKWIDVNLTTQVVTAYERDTPVYWAVTSTGRPGWETPVGTFAIGRRVEKETMDSETLLGRDAERADYRIENIRWTQYFTNEGHALHENYWKPPDTFGIPSSHGCLGLSGQDAEWFWRWAEVGTQVFVHQ